MSSTASRRMRRKMDRDIKKNIKGDERDLQIPTEEEIQIYINNKIEELKSISNVQLQETTKD
jgi:hypothetical protein